MNRPIFNHEDAQTRWEALEVLRGAGFFVRADDNLLILTGADATDAQATQAGNLLVAKGFGGGICW